jgi:hypothetical protein
MAVVLAITLAVPGGVSNTEEVDCTAPLGCDIDLSCSAFFSAS